MLIFWKLVDETQISKPQEYFGTCKGNKPPLIYSDFFLYYVDDGEGYSITESLRFLEEVANASLSLSNIIVNSAWYGAEVLRRHGSPELKVS